MPKKVTFQMIVAVIGLLAFVPSGSAAESGLLCTDAIPITGIGVESFVLDPAFLDGPQRGPTNDLGEIFAGPSTTFWASYGPGGILDAFQFGDLFGIYMGVPAGQPFIEGGDAWMRYTSVCTGTASFDANPLGEGTLTDSQLEAYPGSDCPTDWKESVAWDEDGGPGYQASMDVLVEAGEPYLVRIGGWAGESGTGVVHYGCNHEPTVDVQDSINLGSRGLVPVLVLGSDSFDVTNVEGSSLSFGPGGAAIAHTKGPHTEDMNHDGIADLTGHFRLNEIGVEVCDECSDLCASGELCLPDDPAGCSCKSSLDLCISGTNVDGTTFSGCDLVKILSH